MKRLTMLLVAGILLGPVSTKQAVASGWVQPVQYNSVGCCQFMQGCGSLCDDHLGIDWMVSSAGRPVYAMGTGYDVNYYSSAGSFGGCGVDGGALWIKHRKSNGSYFWALYGHTKNPVYTSLLPGQTIPAGMKVCEVANYDPCCPSGPNCPHLHFGIWDGTTYPSSNWGYGTQRSFTDPVAFMQNTSPSDPPYHCTWDSQNPSDITVQPGDIINIRVKYRNTGTQTWQNTGGVGVAQYVELWSCDANGAIVNSWFEPVNWIGCPSTCNDQRVTTCDEAAVAPDGLATFTFQAKVPDDAPVGDVRVWFRPTHGGQVMDDWGGMNVFVHVRINPPGTNLSFEEDAQAPSGVPDGWNVGGNGFSYPISGGPNSPRYVQFTHGSSGETSSIGRPLSELTSVVSAGTSYRLQFWYKTDQVGGFEWQVGGTTLTSVGSPLADNQWHLFWGQPFTLTQGQIDTATLAFVYGTNRIGTAAIDEIAFLPLSPCP